MNLFQEISRTNRAYCASLGLDCDAYDRQLSDAELNGTPLSFEERMRAEQLRTRKIVVRQQRDIRLRNRNYAPGRFINFANRERWIRSRVEG